MNVYANFRPLEGNVTTEVTLTFDIKVRRISIVNDSVTTDLNFKFNNSESFGTLGITEQVSMDMNTRTVILKSSDGVTSIPYRVWGIG